MSEDHRDTIQRIKDMFIYAGKVVPTDIQCDIMLDMEIMLETNGLGNGLIEFMVEIAEAR